MSRCCVVVGRYSVYVSCRFSEVHDLSVVPLLGGTVSRVSLFHGTVSKRCAVSGSYSECCIVVRMYGV